MITFLEEPLRGPLLQCNEVNATPWNKIERDAIYTPGEKKDLKPNKDCITMYARNNHEAKQVCSFLRDMDRVMEKCVVSADSIYQALIYQISHKKEKYKAFEMWKQFAYYLAKHPDIFKDIVSEELNKGESYESLVLNMLYGLSFPKVNVICAIFVKMWNTPFTVVYPSGVEKKYHDVDSVNDLVVIVCNGMQGDDCQYTATKKDTLEWRPIKPLDWSCPVKLINNVKAAHELGEKLYRKRTAENIKKEYNRCDLVIVYMKEKLVDMYSDVKAVEEELNSMKSKIKLWTRDIHQEL